jgi:hypothetical protein
MDVSELTDGVGRVRAWNSLAVIGIGDVGRDARVAGIGGRYYLDRYRSA